MMKAAVLRALNTPLVVEEFAVPDPGEGQLLVRIVASGICHSQVLEARGKRGVDRFLPHLLGHEAAGIVEAIGPRVSRVRPGDHVVLTWIKGPGLSMGGGKFVDSAGRPVNSGPIATFGEKAIVSEDRATPIRKDMPLDLAALLGCAVATGAGAVFNTAGVKPGEKVVVFGAGGIGLNAIQAAALSGAAQVIAVDIHAHKLDQARTFGATHLVNSRIQDAASAIQEITGAGPDVAIESAGQRVTMEQAFACVRIGGGRAILVGNLPAGQSIAIDPFQLICGKQILGSWGGGTQPAQDIPRYVDLFLEGKLKLAEVVSHRFRLERINEAIDALEKGEVTRALLEF